MKTIKMKREDWKKWDTALRNGEYKQGHSYLHDNNRFCCLGVLVDVLGGEIRAEQSFPDSDWLESHGITFNDGIANEMHIDPILDNGDISAASLNDDGLPFSYIADRIAECVEFTDEKE